jgi:hypothetical protein
MILREVWRASGRKTPWRVRGEGEILGHACPPKLPSVRR